MLRLMVLSSGKIAVFSESHWQQKYGHSSRFAPGFRHGKDLEPTAVVLPMLEAWRGFLLSQTAIELDQWPFLLTIRQFRPAACYRQMLVDANVIGSEREYMALRKCNSA